MSSGVVEWFDPVRGYGFIRPDDGTRRVIVRAAAVDQAGLAAPLAGQKLRYLLRHDFRSRKNAAVDLTAATQGPAGPAPTAVAPAQQGDRT